MLVGSVLIGIIGGIAGYWLARWLDTNIGAAIVTVLGLLFALVFFLSPQRGLLALAQRRRRQRWEFAQTMLAIHLLHHEGTPQAEAENRVEHLWEHFRWQPQFAEQVVRYGERKGKLRRRNGRLSLTPDGRQLAQEAMVR
jgi:manganese/zinc/iron transport system permease protein